MKMCCQFTELITTAYTFSSSSAFTFPNCLQNRDVREWLLTLPFHPIPIYSIPIPSRPIPNFFTHSHFHGFPSVLFPFPPIPIPIYTQRYSCVGLYISVWVLHYHRRSTEILIVYYHCIRMFSMGSVSSSYFKFRHMEGYLYCYKLNYVNREITPLRPK